VSREDWFYQLTNRIFYVLFFDRLKEGSAGLDLSDLFEEAAREAKADIAVADEKGPFLDGRAWHIMGGVLSFFGLLLGEP
jgi:hypothetical protein